MPKHFPYTGYRFGVYFLFPKFNFNAEFQSVTGLGFTSGGKDLVEGGVNGFKHKLTDQGTYSQLNLKRGFTKDQGLYEWCASTHETLNTLPCNILISLLDKKGMPEKNWLLFNAIPKGWTAGELNATNNTILVESIPLSYQNFILF